MPHRAITTLQQTLGPHVGLSKSRLETLCLIVVGMVSARTVNLSHLACERPSTALVASTYRRLQRFFQHVRLGADWSAPLVVGLLGLDGPWLLALDRTQWKLGTRDVNILVLAVVTPRARVPLIWSVLDNNGGNSDSGERIALMRRYLAIFGAASIRLLLADREFVGRAWMNFLNENNIPFAIRMKEKLIVTTEDGRRLALGSALRKCRGVRTFRAALGAALGHDQAHPLWLNFAARRLDDGALLIVASNTPARAALAAYRKRWAIECLFGDTKSRGFNLEDTRLVTPRKLALLLGLVALAVAWAARTAAILLGRKAPARKSHGYLAKSWFRIGFDQLRRLLRHDPLAAAEPWLGFASATPRKC
jgi:Transposase DDE domain